MCALCNASSALRRVCAVQAHLKRLFSACKKAAKEEKLEKGPEDQGASVVAT